MYDPPGYLWAITIAGIIAIPAATCVVLYGGAVRAGLSRRRAALLAGGAAVVLGGWFTASAVIAGHGWYHARHQRPRCRPRRRRPAAARHFRSPSHAVTAALTCAGQQGNTARLSPAATAW